MKHLKKKLTAPVVVAIIVIIAGIIGYFVFSGNGKVQHKTENVSYGTVIKEVSETGAVKISDKNNLGFNYSGKISRVNIKIGDEVESGQEIARLDSEQQEIELSQYQANLAVAKADYDRLLAGYSAEEIQVAQAQAYNAEITLSNAKQTLEDSRRSAEQDLEQDYESGLDDLDSAYLNLYNASNDVENIQRDYFSGSDQESLNVKESKNVLLNAVSESKNYIDQAKADGSHDKIDLALNEVKKLLSKAKDALAMVRTMSEKAQYRNVVSSADKTILDNHKSYINTAYASVVSAQQAISATRLDNEKNINSAQSSVFSAQASLDIAKEQLALKQAGPTKENIELYLAKVIQAEAQVSFSQKKLQDTILRSPVKGRITDIYKREGEAVQATEPIVGFLPDGPFQIEADIYEEDIVYVDNGDTVRISLPAFPDDEFTGKVILVNPAEKIVNGVVYYQIKITIDNAKDNIKPGMTADIVIESEKRDGVLIVPRRAVKRKGNEKIIMVLDGKDVEERLIETGLEGNDYIEVISGLSEGEQAIID